jgi:Rrf2 family protein
VKLEITRKADLATRALLVLGRADDRWKAKALAHDLGTTPGFLTQVMAPLVTRRWVHSEPGPSGGYRGVVDLSGINVLEVIEAVEGPVDTEHCVLEDRTCKSGGACALHQPWSRARTQLLAELAATPLSTLPAPPRAAPRNQRKPR